MVSSGQLAGVALASVILVIIPGPGVLFIVGRALSRGRRTALATALGHASGNYLLAAFIAVGLGAVLERSAQVFLLVKLAGALYLVWLGVHAVRHRKELAAALDTAGPGPEDGRRALRDGIIVGLTNPKGIILFGAIIPVFVTRAAGDVPAQMLELSAVPVAIGMITDTAWGLAASAVRAWFASSPRRYAAVGGAGGLAMIAVGITIALTGRND